MSCCAQCGTHGCACGCGPAATTPLPLYNRPGLSSLRYRVGQYDDFFATMEAGLSDADRPALGAFKSREPSDLSIALLDAWAVIGDVLTFYQERIANEGYLRTATERRSVLELARLIDYRLRPGVAASVYLAYTIEKDSPPVTLPVGSRAQTIPGPGEQMQTFETSEPLPARYEWNQLKPRLTRPQDITVETVAGLSELWVSGIATNLRANDRLLFLFGDLASGLQAIRLVDSIEIETDRQRTRVILQAPDPLAVNVVHAAGVAITTIDGKAFPASLQAKAAALRRAFEQLRSSALLVPGPGLANRLQLLERVGHTTDPTLQAIVQQFMSSLGVAPPPVQASGGFNAFIAALTAPPSAQPSNRLRLARDITTALGRGSDARPQLLLNFRNRLVDNFYRAWTNAPVEHFPAPLSGVYAMRVSAPLFGYNAARLVGFGKNTDGQTKDTLPVVAKPDGDWDVNEQADRVYLDNAYDGIKASSFLILQSPSDTVPVIAQAETVALHPRSDYGLSTKTTDIQLVNPDPENPVWDLSGSGALGNKLRGSQVFAQSELLTFAEQVIADDVGADDEHPDAAKRLTLDSALDGFEPGRWVVVQGRRADVPGTDVVSAAELVMVEAVEQGTDPALSTDTVHTTLVFANEGLNYRYERNTVTVLGNVVHATHGETRTEILGSGDGAKSFQAFALKQSPLTYTSAATADGVESSLTVRINGVAWHETRNLAFVDGAQRSFVTSADDDRSTTITFGDGTHGARLPTGTNNVTATYRNGIGAPGNVKAQQISLLAAKPLGVKEVINPLRASGGADPETRDQARDNAPLAVMALDRLVSIRDYADFARTFAGVGKASATRLRDQAIVTIAGVDDAPIDVTSDLYRNLNAALLALGDPTLALRVLVRELLAVTLSAKVGVAADYEWEEVEPRVRQTLLDRFGFARRSLAQTLYASEIVAAIQNVRGVAWVDVDAFGSIDEASVIAGFSDSDEDGLEPRSLRLTRPLDGIVARPARYDVQGILHAAQMAYLLPTVPDTLILQEAT